MKNKIIVFFFLTISFVSIYSIENALAYSLNNTLNNGDKVVVVYNPQNQLYSTYFCPYNWSIYHNTLNNNRGSYFNKWNDTTVDPIANPDANIFGYYNSEVVNVDVSGKTVVAVRGTIGRSGNGNYEYFNSAEDYLTSLIPTWQEGLSEGFREFYRLLFGVDIQDGSAWDTLLKWLVSTGEPDEVIPDLEFPTNIPTPTPTPLPTPIPYRIIYVPDGNGNTTKIYKYIDPDTGNPTESPYDPNPTYQPYVTVPITDSPLYNPENPLKIDDDYFQIGWKAGGSQNEFDNPLLVGSESVDMVKGGVDEYDDSIKIVSNSIGALPSKWLILIGIVASIPIIAGIIKSMLGG